MQNEFKDIINYIKNESINKNIDIYKNNTGNENIEKGILEKKICIIENQLQNILSQIKEIDSKISKSNKEEIILKKKDDAMKNILLNEKKNYEIEIENNIKSEINQKIKKDDDEKANNIDFQKEK